MSPVRSLVYLDHRNIGDAKFRRETGSAVFGVSWFVVGADKCHRFFSQLCATVPTTAQLSAVRSTIRKIVQACRPPKICRAVVCSAAIVVRDHRFAFACGRKKRLSNKPMDSFHVSLTIPEKANSRIAKNSYLRNEFARLQVQAISHSAHQSGVRNLVFREILNGAPLGFHTLIVGRIREWRWMT